jgi:hypothetical protein
MLRKMLIDLVVFFFEMTRRSREYRCPRGDLITLPCGKSYTGLHRRVEQLRKTHCKICIICMRAPVCESVQCIGVTKYGGLILVDK